jgi:hypothetical protein
LFWLLRLLLLTSGLVVPASFGRILAVMVVVVVMVVLAVAC